MATIKELRERKGLSVTELSRMTGLTRPTIYRLEQTNKEVRVNLKTAHALAEALGVGLEDLF